MSPIISNEYKKCPNCKAMKFYVDNESDGMVFFRVTASGETISSQDPPKKLELKDVSQIYCISCGWHGILEELI